MLLHTPHRMALRQLAATAVPRRALTSGAGESYVPGGAEFTREGKMRYNREKWGKRDARLDKLDEQMDRQMAWGGPKVGTQRWVEANYHGNMNTPTWLLGENGDEIAAKCKEVFRGFEQTSKKIVANYKMRVIPGRATAAPPIGPVFSSQGVKSMEFINQFNERTAGVFAPDTEIVLKVHVRFYEDKTFQFKVKPPPTAMLLRRVARIPKTKKKWGIGPGPRFGDYTVYGYVTLQQLYHVAALVNTWDFTPDWFPLEYRVHSLWRTCQIMGLKVLGVDTPPQPQLGFTDAQFQEHIQKKKEEWMAKRREELNLNPLQRVPWMQKNELRVWGGIKLPHHVIDNEHPTQKSLIQDAQAVDKKFQKLIDDNDARGSKKKENMVYWDEWRRTSILTKEINQRHAIEEAQIEQERSKRVKYLMKKQPSLIHKNRHHRSLWFSNDWDQLKGEDEPLHTRIR